MNYGRRLAFGVVLTPDGGTAEAAVDLAQRAEALGLEVALSRDDPDQSPEGAAGDSWTLLSSSPRGPRRSVWSRRSRPRRL